MTKKQLEAEVERLAKLVAELERQVFELRSRPVFYPFQPKPANPDPFPPFPPPWRPPEPWWSQGTARPLPPLPEVTCEVNDG